MDNHYNYPFNYFKYGYGKEERNYKDPGSPDQRENYGRKGDEDLIIEENTIYEIDRECMERLKRNKKRII